jgi:hypothetical protein
MNVLLLPQSSLFYLFAIAVTLIAVPGCDKKDQLPTAPARGTVTIDGQPLGNAQVIFTPEKGRTATAQTSADGSFVLSTYDESDGAVVGHHQATVSAREPGQENAPGAPGITRPGRSLIPDFYSNTATSGLSFDVVDGQENIFGIRLVSQGSQ